MFLLAFSVCFSILSVENILLSQRASRLATYNIIEIYYMLSVPQADLC